MESLETEPWADSKLEFEELPEELAREVLCYLSPSELCESRRVCKEWNRFAALCLSKQGTHQLSFVYPSFS